MQKRYRVLLKKIEPKLGLTLEDLVRSRAKRLGIEEGKVLRGLQDKPECVRVFQEAAKKKSMPLNQYMAYVFALPLAPTLGLLECLDAGEIRHFVLYNHLDDRRREHYEQCEACQSRVRSTHPSRRTPFEVESVVDPVRRAAQP